MSRNLTQVAFAENLNTSFQLQHKEMGAIELQLISVSELKATPRQQMYSILLRGPLDLPFGQGLYKIEHTQMGTFDLFLVPVAKEADGFRYQAVFNQLVK